MESHIIRGEKLGLKPDEPMVGKFRKRYIDQKNIEATHKHLADQRESHMSAEVKQMTPSAFLD